MKIIYERSHRHLHLTAETAFKLFGDREVSLRPLSVKGQYATDIQLPVPCVGPTTVLYPWRDYDQLEVSMAEHHRLFGTYAIRRESGDLRDAWRVDIGEVSIPVIVPRAHVHLPRFSSDVQEELTKFPFVLDVKFCETVDDYAYVHLDNDQFNAVQGYTEGR